MIVLDGVAASPGIAIGTTYFFTEQKFNIPEYEIPSSEVEHEIRRFHHALKLTEKEIQSLQQQLSDSIEEKYTDFFDMHKILLKDPMLVDNVEDFIKTQNKNAEFAIYHVMEKNIKTLSKVDDAYIRERVTDLFDVGRRILHHLLKKKQKTLANLDKEVVVIANELTPSDTASMRKDKVIGFATDKGGRTSHIAIVARALEIPAVVGLENITEHVRNDTTVIIDGVHGKVIIEPDKQSLREYRTAKHVFERFEEELNKVKDLDPITKDGHRIEIMGNIEVIEELDSVLNHGGAGVGLYRTEFLYLDRKEMPTEEELFRCYKSALERMKGRKVTFRTLDLGGDKLSPSLKNLDESNPFLGYRAIRYCLSNLPIFETQLRAILRASQYGTCQLMIPMVSNISEISRTKQIITAIKEELINTDIPFDADMQIGVMMEIPSVAMIAEIIAEEVDFMSIGTNDLVQYALAVDRTNEKIAYLYDHFHPGVIRMIQMIVQGAHAKGIPVHICGEMASDPLATMLLIGLGLDELSMAPASIPEIKKIIRSVTRQECRKVLDTVLTMKSMVDINRYLYTLMSRTFPDIIGKRM